MADAIATAAVKFLQYRGLSASKCNFKIKSTCRLSDVSHENDDCVAPHAMFSGYSEEKENEYWKESLFSTIINFYNGDNIIGTPDLDSEFNDGSECQTIDTTMGFGRKFDLVGPEYLKAAKHKFRGWFEKKY